MWDYSVGKNQISIFCSGESRTVAKGFPKFKQLKQTLLDEDFSDEVLEDIYTKMYIPAFIEKFSEGELTVDHENGVAYYGAFAIKHSLVNQLMKMLTEGEDVLPLVRFLEKLLENPKENIVEELYAFMKHNDIEINKQGNIVAFKRVNGEFKDCHTNTIDNSVGTTVKMPRTLVDDDPNSTCSTGLHFCAYSYVKSFYGDNLVKVEVNPKNVVSIPVDYEGAKGRCCEYTVIEDVSNMLLEW